MDYLEKLTNSPTLERVLIDAFHDDVKNGNTNVQYAVGKVLEEILTKDQVFTIMKRAHDLHVVEEDIQRVKVNVFRIYKDAVGYHVRHPNGAEYELGDERNLRQLITLLRYGVDWKPSDLFVCEWIEGMHTRNDIVLLLETEI